MRNRLHYQSILRILITLVTVAAAAAVGWRLWQHYEVEPWTRDGRVKAYVVEVAPDVTGQVTNVYVRDNQEVKIGQKLFDIDGARFDLALRQAEAAEQAQNIALKQAVKESQRNSELKELVSQEMHEQGQSRVDQINSALSLAKVNLEVARLNVARTRVVSAANGVVTNLDLHSGSYVTAGRPVMALVDRDSVYVEGYFEETKLPLIHVGDPAAVVLMGQRQVLKGHVESFAEGIADRDRTTSSNLLPNVNPTFSWVRLAQRIPVRIALDRVPPDTRLVIGQTATIDILQKPASLAARTGNSSN
ncbi:MAG: HlyD family secretion protein [Burkholderiaceae bacterium]|nr:HlyD family secretion protein [Burkholderiaceae bacterium]